MTARRITATYHIETAYPLREAVETMAGEQSTGTFVRLPGETDEMRELYGAHIESVTELGEAAEPSLPGSGVPKGAGQAGVAAGRGGAVVAARQHRAVAAQPAGHGRRQSVRAAGSSPG